MFPFSKATILAVVNLACFATYVHGAAIPRDSDVVRAAVLPSQDFHKRDSTSVYDDKNSFSPFGYQGSYSYSISPVEGDCVYLEQNNVCGPEFAGFPVPADSNTMITTSHGFDAYISNVVNHYSVVENLNQYYGCGNVTTSTVEKHLRYQTSIWCVKSVQRGFNNGCSARYRENIQNVASNSTGELHSANIVQTIQAESNKNLPFLLQSSSCDIAIGALSGMLLDTSICKDQGSTSISNRKTTITALQSVCAQITSTSTANSGIASGSYNEAVMCGWSNINSAVSGCKAFFKLESNNNSSNPYVSELSSEDISNTVSCCKALKSNPEYSSAFHSKSLSGGAIAGIVIGSVVFLILLIVAIVLCCRRHRKKEAETIERSYSGSQRANTSSSTASRTTTTKSFLSRAAAVPTTVTGFMAGTWNTMKRKASRKVTVSEPAHADASGTTQWNRESFQEKSNLYYVDDSGKQVPFQVLQSGTTSMHSEPQSMSASRAPSVASNATGSSTTMPTVRPGAFAVLHGYNPTMEDEMKLEAGDAITLLCKFDDGWGIGCICSCERPGCPGSLSDLAGCKYNGTGLKPLPNCKVKSRGVFPLICGTEFEVSEADFHESSSFEFDEQSDRRKSIINRKLEAIYERSRNNNDSLAADHRRSSMAIGGSYANLVK